MSNVAPVAASSTEQAIEKRLVAAFLFGNFLIGTGIMLAPGLLLDIARDLQRTLPETALMISIAAAAIGIGAPLFAMWTSRIDRRWLLCGSLLLYGIGHVAAALAPDLPTLIAVRTIALLGAAIFTPQAAATLGLTLAPEKRAAAITTIFLGWSIASVIGTPIAAWFGAHYGWRATTGGFGALCFIGVAWCWFAVPNGIKAAPLSWRVWLDVAKHPLLVPILLVTLAYSSGQFSMIAYIAPYVAHLTGPSPTHLTAVLFALGLAGVIGNVWASRRIAAKGAESNLRYSLIAMTMGLAMFSVMPGGHWAVVSATSVAALWGVMLASFVWGLGTFSSNSTQQVRLAQAAPALAGASIALNTSMIYLGQAIGTTAGGALIASIGMDYLNVLAAFLVALSVILSKRATQKIERAR